MPRVSKLSTAQLEELKNCLFYPSNTQKRLSIQFGLAQGSVAYYKKKFVPTVAQIYAIRTTIIVQPKAKTYEDYLKDYYKRIGKPYQVPPVLRPYGRYLTWL